jgi:AraC-like DNA-binding protein
MLQEIVDLTMDATTRPTETGIPRVLMIKGNVPQYQLAALYEPVIGFVVQGSKILSIGGHVVNLKAPSYFLLPIHVPATATVRSTNNGLPYLSVGLSLSKKVVRDLLRDVSRDFDPTPANNFSGCAADPEFIEAWLRMLRLTITPRDIPALAPVYEREILYRVLMGPNGSFLKHLALRESNLSRISQAVNWLRQNYKQPINITQMASEAAMAITTFHRQFKRVTGLSPIQFQKQLRLFEARNILAFEGYAVANAAYEVGYQSASQFNREYARFFGAPPARDASILREIELTRGE